MWLATFAVLLVIVSSTTISGATFTSSSTNPNSVFSTAASFQLQVSLANPGTPLRGSSVALTATASDTGGSTVNNVTFQRSPAGANTWTNICAPDTSSPYTCTFNTTAVADGLYDLRAVVTNSLGATSDAIVVNRLLDNTAPTGTVGDPGAWFGGTITLGSTVSDASPGSGVTQVRYEYKTTAGSTWTTACTANASPWTCAFNASGLTTNTAYDFRAVVTDGAGNSTTSAAVTNRRADNTIPSGAALTDPGTPLAGTITLAGTAADANSGIQTTRMQVSPAGANTWSDACTDATSPYSCSFDTTTVADGLYDMRLQAVDAAGNIRNSGVRTNRRIDNTAPQLTFTDPGQYLVGTSTRTATATDGGSGVLNVQFQYRQQGGAPGPPGARDASSPYTCNTNTTQVADGMWEWRAVATDNAGLTTTSTVYTSRIDNTAPSGHAERPRGAADRRGEHRHHAGRRRLGAGDGHGRVPRPEQRLDRRRCVLTQAPWTCNLNTAAVADGDHDFRTTAVDRAGNTTVDDDRQRPARRQQRTDGTDGERPGCVDVGTRGPHRDRGRRRRDGRDLGRLPVRARRARRSWSTACTDLVAPYTCNLDTTSLTDGAYLRPAILATDGAGFSATSPVVANRRVDNSAPARRHDRSRLAPDRRGELRRHGLRRALGRRHRRLSVLDRHRLERRCARPTRRRGRARTTPRRRADGPHDLRALATDQVGNAVASATVPRAHLRQRRSDRHDDRPGSVPARRGDLRRHGLRRGTAASRTSRSSARRRTRTPGRTCARPTRAPPYECANIDTTTLGGRDLRPPRGRRRRRRPHEDLAPAHRSLHRQQRADRLADRPGHAAPRTVALAATVDGRRPVGRRECHDRALACRADTWTTICVDTSSAYGCNWDTTLAADGAVRPARDLRRQRRQHDDLHASWRTA